MPLVFLTTVVLLAGEPAGNAACLLLATPADYLPLRALTATWLLIRSAQTGRKPPCIQTPAPMSVTSYERLRITHRTLLKNPPTPLALEALLEVLPGYLQEIAVIRPALVDEVDACQQRLRQVHKQLGRKDSVDMGTLIKDLHQTLSPLFAG